MFRVVSQAEDVIILARGLGIMLLSHEARNLPEFSLQIGRVFFASSASITASALSSNFWRHRRPRVPGAGSRAPRDSGALSRPLTPRPARPPSSCDEAEFVERSFVP